MNSTYDEADILEACFRVNAHKLDSALALRQLIETYDRCQYLFVKLQAKRKQTGGLNFYENWFCSCYRHYKKLPDKEAPDMPEYLI